MPCMYISLIQPLFQVQWEGMLNVTSGVTTKLSLQGQKESADIATTATLLLPPPSPFYNINAYVHRQKEKIHMLKFYNMYI